MRVAGQAKAHAGGSGLLNRLDGSAEYGLSLTRGQLGEVLVVPAVARELATAIKNGAGVVRPVSPSGSGRLYQPGRRVAT
jgi:hypothetical protein